MDVDSGLKTVGLFGRVQIVNLLIFGLGLSTVAIQLTAVAITIDQSMEHYCKPPLGLTANETTPLINKDGRETPDSCHMFVVLNGTLTENTTTCQSGWEYPVKYQRGETSTVTDLNLVCDRSILAGTLTSVHFAGVLVGGFFTGQAADMFGRRTVTIATLLLAGALGTGISFTWNFELMLALRFLLGFAIPGNSLVGYIRGVEMFTPEKRLVGHVLIQTFWSIGVMLVAPIAYLLPDWRNFQLATSLLCLPIVLLMWFFTYESLRWLVQKGHADKAEALLRRIAKSKNIHYEGNLLQPRDKEISDFPDKFTNQGISISDEEGNYHTDTNVPNEESRRPNSRTAEDVQDHPDLQSSAEDNVAKTQPKGETSKKYTVLDLFKTKILIKYTCIIFFCWFVMNMVYFGFIVYATLLAGNKYLNFFLLALVEAPVYIIDFFIVGRFGRRRPLIFFFFASGVACFLTGFLPANSANGTDLTALIVAVAMIGKFYSIAAFEVTLLVGAEIFPTVLRNIATGSASTVGRAGAMVAPFIVYMRDVQSFLPMTIFGSLSLVTCVFVFLLPETRNKPLPETYKDATQGTTYQDEESAL